MFTHQLLELNSNENSLGIAASAQQAIIDTLNIGFRYPDEQRAALIHKIAEIHGVSQEQLSLGNGSSENIGAVVRMLQHRAMIQGLALQLVVPHPTFAYAERFADLLGVSVVKVALTEGSYDLDIQQLQQAADDFEGISLFYLCNPNNPTATITDTLALKSWISRAPKQHYFLLDEAYADYVTDPSFESGISWVKQCLCDNLLVVRTFSKLCALAGMRIGYAIASEQLINACEAFMAIDNTNLAGAVAALTTLNDAAYLSLSLQTTEQSRQMTQAALDELGLRYLPSQANFIYHDINAPQPGGVRTYIERMRQHGIVVGREFPPIEGFNRLTLGTPDEMAVFIRVLKSFRQQGWV